MNVPYRLLRDALWQLSLEPDEQRKALAGMAVTDELANDLDNAVLSLNHAEEEAGVALTDEVRAAVTSLLDRLDAPPEADLWDDEALDRHSVWSEARVEARRLLPLLPQSG